MARVQFQRVVDCRADGGAMWQALVDWQGHGRWIPATRVRILTGDGGVGTVFVARSGVGPLGFDDTMRVDLLQPERLHAAVTKLGPLLTGGAGFTVRPRAAGSQVEWFEDVQVRWLPRQLSPLVAAVSSFLFASAIRRLDAMLLR